MKNKVVILTTLIALIIIGQSCKKMQIGKHKHTETKEAIELNVNLKYGETYTYTLPTNQSDDAYAITAQATNFTTSELNATNTVYTYVAQKAVVATSYTDDVTIANVEEAHPEGEHQGGGHCNGGGCGNHIENEIERTIHIHFTVSSTGGVTNQ
jgi:hypothetical protein